MRIKEKECTIPKYCPKCSLPIKEPVLVCPRCRERLEVGCSGNCSTCGKTK